MDARAVDRKRFVLTVAATLVLGAAGCGGGADEDRAGPQRRAADETTKPKPPPYRPRPAEAYPNGKRIAAAAALRTVTYPRGSSPADVARGIGRSRVGRRALAAAVAPAVDSESASTAEIVYPQLSGVTPTSLGAMVIVRQTLEAEDGETRSHERVIDVRLALAGGRWVLDRIGDVGGGEAERPESLSTAAERLLADDGIDLSDSARWDIYRGGVDDGLLRALADAGRRFDFAVGILDSGHPPNVWATPRRSAHSVGYAADIHEVDGRLVIDQREAGSPAHKLAAALAPTAAQLGSPWVFGVGTFTDDVHQDHLHLQRSPTP